MLKLLCCYCDTVSLVLALERSTRWQLRNQKKRPLVKDLIECWGASEFTLPVNTWNQSMCSLDVHRCVCVCVCVCVCALLCTCIFTCKCFLPLHSHRKKSASKDQRLNGLSANLTQKWVVYTVHAYTCTCIIHIHVYIMYITTCHSYVHSYCMYVCNTC